MQIYISYADHVAFLAPGGAAAVSFRHHITARYELFTKQEISQHKKETEK